MTEDLIDYYINLLRIKAAETGENRELELQLRITRLKLTAYNVDVEEIEKMVP